MATYYYSNMQDARARAQKLANDHMCMWYIVKWSDDRFEPVGPHDMYYNLMRDAIKVNHE